MGENSKRARLDNLAAKFRKKKNVDDYDSPDENAKSEGTSEKLEDLDRGSNRTSFSANFQSSFFSGTALYS